MKKHFFILFFFQSLLFLSCKSVESVNQGIQTRYESINPGAILALPIIILPSPGIASQSSIVDHAIWHSWHIENLLEERILAGFSQQPNVHGIDFQSVKKALGDTEETALAKQIVAVAKRFSSTHPATRSLITNRCLAQRGFLDFYKFCLSEDPSWIEGLNQISEKAFNADAALLTVVNNLQIKVEKNLHKIEGTVSVLLVDTNNGELIWGRSKVEELKGKKMPLWSDLFLKMFDEEFWQNFPGRIEHKRP